MNKGSNKHSVHLKYNLRNGLWASLLKEFWNFPVLGSKWKNKRKREYRERFWEVFSVYYSHWLQLCTCTIYIIILYFFIF